MDLEIMVEMDIVVVDVLIQMEVLMVHLDYVRMKGIILDKGVEKEFLS